MPSNKHPSGLASHAAAFGRWHATLLLLMAENFGSRYKRTRWSALFAIVEPLALVALFTGIHALISVRPVYGTSNFLFYASGILPFYLFVHVSLRTRTMDHLKRLPQVTEFDILLSHILDEFLIKIVVIVACFGGLYAYGVSAAIPREPTTCLLALITLAGIGFGVGMINAVIVMFFSGWNYIYGFLVRGFMAFSGILFVVDWMPPNWRHYAAYNPISHAITWFRAGVYPTYPTLTLDLTYLLTCSILVILIGWLVATFTREWRIIK